ncbi:uncharacterized protein BJX67DRAFT_379247 [Aspergillus lucknowensis]|uniref:Uncharacterized protein n=1 Tax=Aspergillus lucknowensis TaxID=176173 RepID=A0ABR4LXF5_9EURO
MAKVSIQVGEPDGADLTGPLGFGDQAASVFLDRDTGVGALESIVVAVSPVGSYEANWRETSPGAEVEEIEAAKGIPSQQRILRRSGKAAKGENEGGGKEDRACIKDFPEFGCGRARAIHLGGQQETTGGNRHRHSQRKITRSLELLRTAVIISSPKLAKRWRQSRSTGHSIAHVTLLTDGTTALSFSMSSYRPGSSVSMAATGGGMLEEATASTVIVLEVCLGSQVVRCDPDTSRAIAVVE